MDFTIVIGIFVLYCVLYFFDTFFKVRLFIPIHSVLEKELQCD